MSWLAEILRKEHRACSGCGLGPTHVYLAEAEKAGAGAGHGEAAAAGAPLCNSCLASALARDLSRFEGRCVVFEPALGPDSLVFHPLAGEAARAWPAEHLLAARACLDGIAASCESCGKPGRFRWVPVAEDACLWAEDWIPGLIDGSLTPRGTLCGRCAAERLGRSVEERALYFEAIVPPAGGDGLLFATEL